MKESKRSKILAAAIQLFSKHGYQQTEMQAIADAASVGKGTLYVYFSSKEELFFAVIEDIVHRVEEHILQQVKSLPKSQETVAVILCSYIQFFKSHPEYVELFVQNRAWFSFRRSPALERFRQQREEKWAKIFDTLQQEGRLRVPNVPLMVQLMRHIFCGILFIDIFQADVVEAGKSEAIVDVLLYGVFKERP